MLEKDIKDCKIYGLSYDYIIIDDQLNFNNQTIKGNNMFEKDNKKFEGTKEEILSKLRELAKSSCNHCFGRGYEGYREDKKTGIREYIPCKCIKLLN